MADKTTRAFGEKQLYRFSGQLAHTSGAVTLPVILSNYPAHGFITCAHASDGSIVESAEFEYGSSGTVNIIRGTANVVANAATAAKVQLGAAAPANPVVITNATAAGLNTMITLWYS
jgi:hypothetical protein